MNTRPMARCAKCQSLERTRLLWMYLAKTEIRSEHRILHVAPERQIYVRLKERVEEGNYVPADFNEKLYHRFAKDCRHIDLCNLDDWPSEQFDLIIHSHVLEHTPCNIAYTLYHLHRMLTATGRHICIIPFMSGGYDESFEDLGDEEKIRRFGQNDHVRRFGRNQIGLHLGKLLNMPEHFDASDDFPAEDLARANIPENMYRGFGISTVLNFGKYDMKMLKEPV